MGRMSEEVEAAPAATPAAGAATRKLPPGSILRAFGFLCLCLASGIAGYLGWLLWGTGLETQRAQNELRQAFQEELRHTGPPNGAVRLPGDAVYDLVIPRLDLDMIVVEGTETADLQKGPGHYAKTADPWDDTGRVGIAGHRTTYLHPFLHLDRLKHGDRITLKTEYGTFGYSVLRVFVIPEAGSGRVLDQSKRPTLVLTTCNPVYASYERLIVTAARV